MDIPKIIYDWQFLLNLELCCNQWQHYTGCPQKNFILLWKAKVPLKIVVGIKVGGFSESAEADLSVEYQNFPVALQGAEIFEFKVDPVPNLTFFNVMSGVESNTFFDFKKGIALLKIIIRINVMADTESAGAELSKTNHSFKGCCSLPKSKKVFD